MGSLNIRVYVACALNLFNLMHQAIVVLKLCAIGLTEAPISTYMSVDISRDQIFEYLDAVSECISCLLADIYMQAKYRLNIGSLPL